MELMKTFIMKDINLSRTQCKTFQKPFTQELTLFSSIRNQIRLILRTLKLHQKISDQILSYCWKMEKIFS